MTYAETISYLYSAAPMFQHCGKKAYKANLDNTHFLDNYFGFPHRKFKSIHVAGTNGKGSTSHFLAATLQAAGYNVGLYTSPHLKDFRERIRINGKEISENDVVLFVEKNKSLIDRIKPSFFEITTLLAFCYFAEQKVDIAVVEVGLGGRLDCTNIISPELSIITNISLDHTDILGDTLQKIASEKAGIIKPKTPVVIGETLPETLPIFEEIAHKNAAPIIFAEREKFNFLPENELKGIYQEKNRKTVLSAINILQKKGWNIPQSAVQKGFKKVVELTHLQGRWQRLGENPTVICDTGHNEGGIRLVCEQLKQQNFKQLHIVFGMVSDKDVDHVLALLPKNAIYYFTKAQIPRALNELELCKKASNFDLKGSCYSSVREALDAAKEAAQSDDFIFVGGSNYIVAEIL